MNDGFRQARFSSARDGEEARDTWRTPRWLYDQLDREFGFRCDVAASAENHLAPLWFGLDHPDPERRDALRPPAWDSPAFLNPPYSRVADFMAAARFRAEVGPYTTVTVCVVFARTETEWWWRSVLGRVPVSRRGGRSAGTRMDCVCAAEIRWVRGRLNFESPDELEESKGNSAPAPSVVVVYRPGYREPWPANGIVIRP